MSKEYNYDDCYALQQDIPGLEAGKQEASETDQVVIQRVKEIKDLMSELK